MMNSGTSKATITQMPASHNPMPSSGQITATPASIQLGSHQYQQPPASAQPQRPTGGGSSPQPQLRFSSGQMPLGGGQSAPQQISRRQDGVELRQRIQNLLMQGDSSQNSRGHTPSTQQQQQQQVVSQFLTMNNPPKQQQPLLLIAAVDNMHSGSSSQRGATRLSNAQKQLGISPHMHTAPNEDESVKHGKRMTHGIVAHGHTASANVPSAPFQQPIISSGQTIQRMLSEERSVPAPTDLSGQQISNSRIKYGFQENLNRRGSNGQSVQVLHPGVIGKGIAQSSNLLNKAAIVTTMLSSNHQQHTTSDSSKVNSQLLAAANMRQSLWLQTTNGAIKSKKVQDMVQSRQKACQFCLANNSPARSSPKLMSSQYLCYNHYHDQLKTLVRDSLDKKYLTSQDYYNSKIVSDVMYNENRHIVSVFKDYLIFDDFSEYLKRYYRDQEAYERLPKVFEFYEKYSKVFPNYVALPAESKYMFKNIERKQKLIDEKHQQMLERQERVRQEQDEAKALGVALDSSVVQRMRHSKNVIFGSQFINDLTELNSQIMAEGDQQQSMLRQQSSKIFDMLHTIQSQAPAYQPTSVMNQFLKSQNSRQNTQQQVNTAQSMQSHKEVNNLEHLICQLAAFDNRNDSSVFYPNHRAVNEFPVPFLTDISLSSSQGMSSFLQDFDLREGGLHPTQDHYRTYNPTQAAFDEVSSRILHTLNDETTPMKLQGSRGSIEDANRLITTISNRQSMPGQPRATPQQAKSNVASNRNSKHTQKKSSKNTPAVQIIPQNQWSNILLQSTVKKSSQAEQVRKVQPIQQQHFLSTGSNNVYQKSNLTQQAQNLLTSSKVTKQPTPKSRPSKLGTGNMLLSTGGSISSGGLQSNTNFLGGGGGGGLSISPPATSSQLMGVGAITVQHSNRLSHTGGRGSLHSADQNQQQVLNTQGATGNNLQQLMNQHLSASSLKMGTQMLQLPTQQQQMSSANGTGGRSSQVSLGSPLSHNSVITHQVTGSMSGGFQHTVSIPSQKAKAITQQILSQITPGSSLKQIATAAAKANLAGNKQVESHSGKKTSSRGSQVGANQSLKPNIHISINPSTGALMPRSGPQTKSNDLVHLTPTSVGAALSQGLLGSAGNSQTSMRISPDFSIQPNMVLSQSTGTVVGPGTLKKMPDISKSFKIPSQTGIVAMTSSSSSKYVNPNSISHSIREAVNKLLPPQPKYQQMSASTHIQQTLKESTVTSSKDSSATAPPQSIMMTNTAALFSKLFTTQKTGGGGAPPQEDASDTSSHQAVYSTRIPQKKNFSSPDDVQLRIAVRKNQHAVTAAQSALQQPTRKSANDFYGDGGESSQSTSPNVNLGKQKMMVVLKGGATSQSTNQPLTKARMDNSPQSTATVSNNYRKVKLLGSESSAEKEDFMMQRQYALRQQAALDDEPFSGVAEEEEQDDELMIDERNDIYTAKGGALQVPVTAGTKSQSSLRGGGRIEGGPDGKGQNFRQQAVSATATSQVNTYNFKMPVQSVTANITTAKRMSSSTSDKSQGSNLKGSSYGGSVSNPNSNPYQRVMTSFSTGTKKKAKAPPPVTIESVQPAHLATTSGSLGSKLYEKIKTGMQVALGHSQTSNSGTSAGTPVITSQKAAALAGKKKPSTIFTFNK